MDCSGSCTDMDSVKDTIMKAAFFSVCVVGLIETHKDLVIDGVGLRENLGRDLNTSL